MLTKIIKKDKNLYTSKGEYFNESDFDNSSDRNDDDDKAAGAAKSKDKKVTYKDV